MRAIFAYRYGILGGVCTQLINRLLSGGGAIEAHLLFAADHGISTTLRGYPHLHFETSPERVRALVRNGGFDVAVVIDTVEYLTALQGAPEVPLVAEVHTTVEQGLGYLRERDWAVDGFIVPSEYSRRMLRERFRIPDADDVRVVPNCLDMRLFPREDVPAPPDCPVLAWVGKLDDHKNWRGFLKIASKVARREERARFWLVGGYTTSEARQVEIVDEMADRGLIDRCRWFPRIEYEAMHRLSAAVRQSGGAVVVSSMNESFGMSVLESLVCGCPVIATDVGALREIAPAAPYLRFYEYGDYSGAARMALELMMDGPEGPLRTMLAADRARFEERFSAGRVAELYALELQRFAHAARRGDTVRSGRRAPDASTSSRAAHGSKLGRSIEKLRRLIAVGRFAGGRRSDRE
jgi:glycosyltransferase involved in cell wall biosynthesis